jgi:hypothetical protein
VAKDKLDPNPILVSVWNRNLKLIEMHQNLNLGIPWNFPNHLWIPEFQNYKKIRQSKNRLKMMPFPETLRIPRV